jgi:hypothetical protein
MSEQPLRVAVVSTPRSGNTWVRTLVAGTFGLQQVASHELSDDDWRSLPANCALQIHWRREPEFVARLDEYGFRVLTVARHPLDVLISVLHFSTHTAETARWLCGRGGDESTIWAAMPRSRPFVEYATGPRAAELLAITCDWWGQSGVIGVRYEDIVADPVTELAKLSGPLGPTRTAPAAVAEEATLVNLRRHSVNSHFWQGRPGLWRSLLPTAEAREIAAAVAPVVATLGYTCDPDPDLDPGSADRNWVALAGPPLRAAIDRATTGHTTQIEYFRATAEIARRQAEEYKAELTGLRDRIAELEARLLPAINLEHRSGRMTG